MRKALALLLAGAVMAGAPAASAQEKLVVWFNKGVSPAEDAALDQVIGRFQQRTGVRIELGRFDAEEIVTRSVAAVDAGNPPDVGFGWAYDSRTAGRWAAEGKLENLNDIVEPLKDSFLPGVAERAHLAGPDGRRGYYGLPIFQQTIQPTYWADMLQEAGFQESDIPADWKGYWSFWCDKVQPALRARGKRVYGIGHPASVEASDTMFSFLTYVTAYDASPVDATGKLLVGDAKIRANMAAALKDYTDIVQKGCTPPGSLSWKDGANDAAFHGRTTVMTYDAGLSLAGKYLEDMRNAADGAARAQATKAYEDLIRTAGWPNRPDGKPLPGLVSTKLAVVFADAPNKGRAKEFLAFLLQPENLTPCTESAGGRWFPVMKEGAESPFWQADLHRRAVHDRFVQQPTVPFQFVYNHRFAAVNAENVWSRAMSRVLQDKVPPEQAVDEMFARIRQLVEG